MSTRIRKFYGTFPLIGLTEIGETAVDVPQATGGRGRRCIDYTSSVLARWRGVLLPGMTNVS